MIENTVKKYNNENIKINLSKRTYLNARKNLIQRCLNNLIDNSIKYAKNINIKLERNNTNIILIIEDDGIGIPIEEYENVFKPFYKIDKSRGKNKSSVGLGLSITSDIVKSHGGDISLGQSEQKGLSVKITLPI